MRWDDDDGYARARSSCVSGKITYLTRREARQDSHRRVGPRAGRMRAYRCGWCRFWHVGHLPPLVREGHLTAEEFYQLARGGNIPMPGQRVIDMTEGILLPREVAEAFNVTVKTTYEWARAYQANNPDSSLAQLPAFLTPGGQWRFSGKAVRLCLEDDRG